MKTFTIFKHCHYSKLFSKPYFIYKGNNFCTRLSFDESCKYDSDKYNELNILFGIKFGYSKNERAYFAWKYNKYTDQIYIFECIINQGNIYQQQICSTSCNELHLFTLSLSKIESQPMFNNKFYKWKYAVNFNIDGVEYTPNNNAIYSNKIIMNVMWPKFGKKLRAPHKIKINWFGR